MLNVGNVKVPLCEGLSRRSFLQVGTAGLASLALPQLLRLEAAGAVGRTRPGSATASRFFSSARPVISTPGT